MSARIRAARPSDLDRLWDLVLGLAAYERMSDRVSGSREALGKHLFGDGAFVECLVLERGGALIGYALFYPTFSSFRTSRMMWLEDLFVEPSERGHGHGRALLAAVCRRCVERGCARLDWHVLDWNEPALRFYERMGAGRAHAEWYAYSLPADGIHALAGEAPAPG